LRSHDKRSPDYPKIKRQYEEELNHYHNELKRNYDENLSQYHESKQLYDEEREQHQGTMESVGEIYGHGGAAEHGHEAAAERHE
jgi:hypothetical protein